jgi:hypothetical protein
MRRKVTVIGDSGVMSGLTQHAKVVTGPAPDAGGADVVVVATGDDLAQVADFVARRCPAAVVVATDAAWCAELLECTRFPRGRVLAAGPASAAAIADAVLGDSGAELDVVLPPGEKVRARVGASGVFAI